MDLIKIGKYISGKRKALGLTQRELAEQLGMSDKSVSKWERGVCLPDVSVYMDLCRILGISINEFLAGEDIGREAIAERAEDNLLMMASDGLRRQKRARWIIVSLAVLLAAFLIAAGVLSYMENRPENVIRPLEEGSTEMSIAGLLSGVDGAYLYRFRADDSHRGLTVTVFEYKDGELTDSYVGEVAAAPETPSNEGMIAVVPDFDTFAIKLIVAGDGVKYSTEIPILEDVEGREYYGRSACQIEGETRIRYGEDQALVAFLYGKDGLSVPDIKTFEEGPFSSDNDYVYYISVRFE